MKQKRKYLTLWGITAAAVITALSLTAATYAWFSSNREVETDKATSRTGTSNVELQIYRPGLDPQKDEDGAYYTPMKGSKEYYKQQGKEQEDEFVLMPVSTPDLTTFVYSAVSSNGFATGFGKVGSEPADEAQYFYHDTIYLKAVAEDGAAPEGAKMALYLDNLPGEEGEGTAGTPIVSSGDGKLLTATRLGLRFSDGSFRILTLSDVNEGQGNSRLDGEALAANMVLGYDDSAGKAVAKADPAIPLADVQIPPEGGKAKEVITELTLNEVYTVDVYFYLEGCDPDCLSDRVGMTKASLNLAFYGLLTY